MKNGNDDTNELETPSGSSRTISPAYGIDVERELLEQVQTCFEGYGQEVLNFGQEEKTRANLAQKYIKFIMLLLETIREAQLMEDFMSLCVELNVDESILIKWRDKQLADMKDSD